jgi:hypothetical protein
VRPTSSHYENLFCAIKRFELISAPERVEVGKYETNATLLSRSSRIFLCERSQKLLRRLCRELRVQLHFSDAFMAIDAVARSLPWGPKKTANYDGANGGSCRILPTSAALFI